MRKALEIGDRTTNTTVLSELYESISARAVVIDLRDLCRRLAVVAEGATVPFDDVAPLAALRRAITQPAA